MIFRNKKNQEIEALKAQIAALTGPKPETDEQRIKREIFERAQKMAEDAYNKEIMFKSLTASDLHFAIIQDLMKAAQLTGLVTITLKDGTSIKIENRPETRDALNRADDLF